MKKSLLISTIILFATQMYGQSVPFVNVSADPYTYSMGGNTLNIDENGFTVSNNASAMTFAQENIYIEAGYNMWQPHIFNNQVMGVSGFSKIGEKLAVGINGKYYIHTPYDITSDQGFASELFTPSEISAEAAVAYKLLKNLSIGANIRFINSTLAPENSGSAIGADISVTYRLKNLRVALAVTNLGSKIDYGYTPYNLPAMAKIGVGYQMKFAEKHFINVTAQGDYLLYKSAVMAGVGAEYSYNRFVNIRAGFHYGNDQATPSYASVGAGIKIIGITLNAAYIIGVGENSPLNGTLCASVGYRF